MIPSDPWSCRRELVLQNHSPQKPSSQQRPVGWRLNEEGPPDVISMFKPQLTLHCYGTGRGCSPSSNWDMNGNMPQILLTPKLDGLNRRHDTIFCTSWYLILGVPWSNVATGVPSRMNVGQIFENLLGSAGRWNGEEYRVGAFDEMFSEEASRGAQPKPEEPLGDTKYSTAESKPETNQVYVFSMQCRRSLGPQFWGSILSLFGSPWLHASELLHGFA